MDISARDQAILQLTRDGWSAARIAEVFEITRYQVRNIRERHRVSRHDPRQDPAKIVALTHAGFSAEWIADLLGTSIRVIWKVRREHKVPGAPIQRPKCPRCGHYVSVPTEHPCADCQRRESEVAVRNAAILRMTRAGVKNAEICRRLDVAIHVVLKVQTDAGVKFYTKRKWSEEDLIRAKQMLTDGASYSEVARTLGRHHNVVRTKFPGYGWTTEQTADHLRAVRNATGRDDFAHLNRTDPPPRDHTSDQLEQATRS